MKLAMFSKNIPPFQESEDTDAYCKQTLNESERPFVSEYCV